jgi:hypothetical protein
MSFFGIPYQADSPVTWVVMVLLLGVGVAAFRWARPVVARAWHEATLAAQQGIAR